MKYIISESQLDKVYKKYFDFEFGDATYEENIPIDLSGELWRGIYLKKEDGNILLIGQPMGSNKEYNMWFYDGTYFTPSLLDISYNVFPRLIMKYVNDRYNLNITSVS